MEDLHPRRPAATRSSTSVGTAFLGQVEALAAAGTGPSVVAVHKGFGADPADLGPAAAAHPGISFLAYHSGLRARRTPRGPSPRTAAGSTGWSVRCATPASAPGGNVFAELGSTWFNVLGDPDQAAHVLGKLLVAVGPERIVWGTDSIWYGSPQDQIEAFRAFEITEAAQEQFGYPALTPEVKRLILGATPPASTASTSRRCGALPLHRRGTPGRQEGSAHRRHRRAAPRADHGRRRHRFGVSTPGSATVRVTTDVVRPGGAASGERLR